MRNILLLLVVFSALVSLSCAQDWSAVIKLPRTGGSLNPIYWLNSKQILSDCNIVGVVPTPACTITSPRTTNIGGTGFETSRNAPPTLNVNGVGGFGVAFTLWFTSTCSGVCVHGECSGPAGSCVCYSGWGGAVCNTPVPVLTSITPFRPDTYAHTITIQGANGVYGDGSNVLVKTNLRGCDYQFYIDAYTYACTLQPLTSQPGSSETLYVSKEGLSTSVALPYSPGPTGLFNGNDVLIQTPVFGLYSIPGIWSNGVINCGSSQCASTITSLVGNTALGTSGWTISFTSTRVIQTSVANSFKMASAGCTSPPCMYGISSGSSAPAQLNFYFGISFWYNSGMYQVYLGQGTGGSSNNWWMGGNIVQYDASQYKWFLNCGGSRLYISSKNANVFILKPAGYQ